MTRLLLFAAAASTLLQGVAHAADSAVVLMYHRFADDRHPSTNIPAAQFRTHLDYLRDNDFTVVSLERLATALARDDQLPERAVVITVDDAYESVYRVAHPLLEQYGYPYTVFVAAESVDRGLPDFMTWSQMREMEDDGVTFANHGYSHGSLIDESNSEGFESHVAWVASDVREGWSRLAEELDPIPGVFAYPYGEFNLTVARTLRDLGYDTVFGQHSGAIGPLSARDSLPRFPMNEDYGALDQFRTKVSSLPLPVADVSPPDPQITTRLPLVEITLRGYTGSNDGVACFVSGQGRVLVEWLVPGERFNVGPEKPLPPGRSRVNCTAPAVDGRFFWYSHPWFVSP